MGIFSDFAPAYWAANLPAIPLLKGTKRPFLDNWQQWGEVPIPDDVKANWLSQYADCNIGLALGPASGLVAIDIDTVDQKVVNVIMSMMPPSPWERRGRKGVVLVFRYAGQKTFRIKDAQGQMLVECLSKGTQIVLPPSIHPDTQKPYTSNVDLFDRAVQAQIPDLTPEIESALRGALEFAGFKLNLSGHTRLTDYVARGARDVQMVAVAGNCAADIIRGHISFNEGIARLVAWHSMCVEKVAGDDVDVEKGVRRIAEFLVRDVTGPKARALPLGWDAGLSPAEKTAFGFDVFQDIHVSWDFDRMKQYIRDEFAIHDPDSAGRRQAVDYLLKKMAKSALDKIDEDRLIKYVVQAGQLGISAAAVKATLHELRQGGIEGKDHTEIAKATIEEISSRGELAFTAGQFWQWKGSHWETLNVEVILKCIADNFGHLPMGKRFGDHYGITKVMANLVKQELSETNETGINFANGFLTPDHVLHDHSPIYGCTYTLPFRYMPELAGRSPMFFDFLRSCWGDDADMMDKIMALQEAMAVTLFQCAPKFERAFCLTGPPKSGKSQMIRIIESLLPSQVVCSVGPETWGDKFLPAQMFGKLLNVCGELSERKFIDGQRFKEIVSGESITGQHKNQAPFKFRATCAHWFASNHIPRTEDTSQGFNRRWLLIVYNKSVSDKDRVLDIGQLIAIEEREAIVAWAVEAITRVMQRHDFTIPASHRERIEEVAKMNNSLRTFLRESGKVLIGQFAASSPTPISEMDIYNAYFTSCIAVGVARPVPLNQFRHRMRELGQELGFQIIMQQGVNGSQQCVYTNITLAKAGAASAKK